MNQLNVDALIIGAGPTGLTLGICLLKQGKSVLIAEKHTSGLNFSRAILINSETLRLLEPYGVNSLLRKHGIPVSGVSIFVNESLVSKSIFNLSDLEHFHPLCLPQLETENCLSEVFTSMGGKLIKGVEFKACVKKSGIGNQIASLIPYKSEQESVGVTCEWLFGCDGYHSAVRDELGIDFPGHQLPQEGYAIDAMLKYWPFDTNLNVWFSNEGAGLAIEIGKNAVRIVGTTKTICENIFTKLPVSNTTWDASFQLHFQVADIYGRDKTWLAGDAVHVHSPIGGRGMNMGIADAVSLANSIKNGDPQKYEITRRPIAKKWVKDNYRITKIVMSPSWHNKLFRTLICGCLLLLGKVMGSKLSARIFKNLSTSEVMTL